jgi:hypothetical protein
MASGSTGNGMSLYVKNLKVCQNVSFLVIQYVRYLVKERPSWFPAGQTVTMWLEDEHRHGPYATKFFEFVEKMAMESYPIRDDYLDIFDGLLFTEIDSGGDRPTYLIPTFEEISSVFDSHW